MSKAHFIPSVEPEVIPAENKPTLEAVSGMQGEAVQAVKSTEDLWNPFEIGGNSESDRAAWFALTINLLRSFDELAQLLRYQLERKSWLNSYLLAAGLNQIAEDYLHSDAHQLGKVVKILEGLRRPVGPMLVYFFRFFMRGGNSFKGLKPVTQQIIRWQERMARFISQLAETALDLKSDPDLDSEGLVRDGEGLLDGIKDLPASLRQEINRLPSSFRSFDQRPEDIFEISREFSTKWPDLQRPITVVGVRTSGSFLAPLYCAYLKSIGFNSVNQMTIRPERSLFADERKVLRETIRKGGLVLLCDDPPISGSTLSKSAVTIEREGVPSQKIILMLQLFGDKNSLPTALKKYPAVLLESAHWSIQRHLEIAAVKEVLSAAATPAVTITGLERIPNFGDNENRDHVSALFRVKLTDLRTNLNFDRFIRVNGVGMGYFGEHAAAVSLKLPEFSARNIALQDGLLFQQIYPTAQPISDAFSTTEEVWANRLVNYVIERNKRFPVDEDVSLRLMGRNAVWEITSNLLSQAFGRAWYLARIPLIDPYVKNTLRIAHPSVIDGDMSINKWLLQINGEEQVIKLDQAEKDFSHQDLFSFDPVYDLACLNLELARSHPSNLREIYEQITGDKIAPERWMFYQLVHLWDVSRQSRENSERMSRRMAAVVQDYYSDIYFRRWNEHPKGALCVFDIDGVLETGQLGYPSLTPTSARSLAALNVHGYRVLLATGRSLGELKERCAAYHLAGGVAEYGAVLYEHESDQSAGLLTEVQLHLLDLVRSAALNIRGIIIDPDYRFSVRAYRLDEKHRRNGLSCEDIDQILGDTQAFGEIDVIEGMTQTDFIAKGVNKGSGLSHWIERFDEVNGETDRRKPFELAVGDSASDLPMLALAKTAAAPANASREVRQAGIHLTRSPYQRGLEQTVAAVLGHKPGECVICSRATPLKESQYMVDILSAQEHGTASMLGKAIKLLVRRMARQNVSP